ncbi:MAG: hypothetical protein HQM03_16565 [Magnetococcales bacterium]|nr:hypothetical protein [Magnetococcales bacterium]
MNAIAADLLIWARGTGFHAALALFLIGLIWRLVEIYTLNHPRHCLSTPLRGEAGEGFKTIFRRFLPAPGMFARAPVTYLGGWVFHAGFFIVLLFFAPHIEIFRELLGIHWPALSNPLIELATVAAMTAMLLVLASRLTCPVKRFLSTFMDYLAWTLTFLPLLTGWMAWHELLLPYTWSLALHVLTADLLLALLPFTRLLHGVTAFPSRWYTGVWFGRKGVQS